MPDSDTTTISLDTLILGGGIAGLWLVDELRRNGYRAVLGEAHTLGAGQTICSQGIIHGGLKYKFGLKGRGSAKVIAAMPPLWRQCLAGQREPKLTGTKILSDGCYIWGAQSQWSRFVAWVAGFGLRVKPITLDRSQWPQVLKGTAGRVYRVAEQVLDPVALVGDLARRNEHHLIKIDLDHLTFDRAADGTVSAVHVHDPATNRHVTFNPRYVVFTAGEGNAELRKRIGLSEQAMQRRPLHMVMLRGAALPPFFGHCIGGTKPRATITANVDSHGRTVWQVGGNPAERGVRMTSSDLIEFTRRELREILPGIDLSGVEWSTYTVNRAEAATAAGQRPDDVHLVRDGNVLTVWPTKLALAPRLAEQVIAAIGQPMEREVQTIPLDGWPRPTVAPPPWERAQNWVKLS